MNTVKHDTATVTSLPARINLELLVVVGLPAFSIMIGVALVIVSYLHGFADLGPVH